MSRKYAVPLARQSAVAAGIAKRNTEATAEKVTKALIQNRVASIAAFEPPPKNEVVSIFTIPPAEGARTEWPSLLDISDRKKLYNAILAVEKKFPGYRSNLPRARMRDDGFDVQHYEKQLPKGEEFASRHVGAMATRAGQVLMGAIRTSLLSFTAQHLSIFEMTDRLATSYSEMVPTLGMLWFEFEWVLNECRAAITDKGSLSTSPDARRAALANRLDFYRRSMADKIVDGDAASVRAAIVADTLEAKVFGMTMKKADEDLAHIVSSHQHHFKDRRGSQRIIDVQAEVANDAAGEP
jgi:hypothetical protein